MAKDYHVLLRLQPADRKALRRIARRTRRSQTAVLRAALQILAAQRPDRWAGLVFGALDADFARTLLQLADEEGGD